MARTLTYSKAHHLSTLHDELIAAGYRPEIVQGEDPARADWIGLTFADNFADEAGVAAVVARHDRDRARREWDEARAREAQDGRGLATVEVELTAAIEGLPAPLTLVALRPVLLAMLRALVRLVRLERRRQGAD